jgi:uncharacterized protein involved in response to NO
MNQDAASSSKPRGGIPRLRPEAIPLLSYGFRPFFLGAAVWACVAMVLWIGLLFGSWSFATRYGVIAWHAHQFLFGYIAAVMTGFLLTAIPNWTGRFPLQPRSCASQHRYFPRFITRPCWSRALAGSWPSVSSS